LLGSPVIGLANFRLEPGDLGLQGFVFRHLALEEARGDAGLGVDAARGEHVGVGELVLAVLEVLGLDPAFVEECLYAVVDLAQAEAEGF
jgi:hypothetical protein